MSCRTQIVATPVGTSVCPAEYSVARPYAASASVTPMAGLSISRSRENMGRVSAGGVPWEGVTRAAVRHRAGQHLPYGGSGCGIDTQVARNHPGDEGRHVRPLAGELDDRAHDDPRFVGRR